MLRETATVILLVSLFAPACVLGDPAAIRIGVLSHRGDATTLAKWSPTADYLTRHLPGNQFAIVPLDFDEVDPAVANGHVDFILVNPGIYVNLEVRYRVSRLATMNNLRNGSPYDIFGGVIFTRADRDDIHTLADLHDKSFMAVDETSLGGFQMAWRQLNSQGIDPWRDFTRLEFAGIHDRVVMAVIREQVDVGAVRTDILERMARAGFLSLEDIRIINPQHTPEFPFVHSTRLYPEWPFSKVRHTSDELALRVAIALLQMRHDHPAATTGNYAGWSIPRDYQQVHELFRELKLPPYAALGLFTLWDAVRRYWYWVLASLAALLAMAGLTSAVVRHNKRLERAKRRLERQHRLILDSVADGIYGVDLHGNSTFVNRAMEAITGWKAEEIIGKNQHGILHHTREDGSRHPPDECPVYATYMDNKPRFIAADVFWKKDGSGFPVEYSCTPIRDQHGETMGSVVVFRDITERRRAEEETRDHQLQLAHVARLSMLGEITSGIAHELNQPLTAITANSRACVRMLDEGGSVTEQCADVMEKVALQAERAGEVIRHIRHFVQKEQPDHRPVRIRSILDTVLELIHREAQREQVKLRLQLDDSAEWVLAQDIQVEQVILNLVRNAIEAMRQTPVEARMLTIRTRRQASGTVEISVTDTGPGLDEAIADQIFNPFVTTKSYGMGLGLSISKGIVEAHGEQLNVVTHPGKGACFSFSLPSGTGVRKDE